MTTHPTHEEPMPDETKPTPTLMVRTEIHRPNRRAPSVRIVDWNDRVAVHRFSRAARECLLAGGRVVSEAVTA